MFCRHSDKLRSVYYLKGLIPLERLVYGEGPEYRMIGNEMERAMKRDCEKGFLPPREDPESLDIMAAKALRRVKKTLHVERPFDAVAYHGFSGPRGAYVVGRVIEVLRDKSLGEDSPWWMNTRDLLSRFTRSRAPGVEIAIQIGDSTWRGTSGGTGYFTARFTRPAEARQAKIEVTSAPEGFSLVRYQQTIPLTLVTQKTPYIVISDIDDTIIESEASDLFRSVKLAFTNNARTRNAVDGMANLYRSLEARAGSGAPPAFFYVTSSSWSLYEMLQDVLEIQRFPKGPMLMQRLGLKQNKLVSIGHNHKIDKIKTILELCPQIPVILIGDSGQQDRTIYESVAKIYPDRVKGIFIRDILNGRGKQSTHPPVSGVIAKDFTNALDLEEYINQAVDC
ncbi:phosphatase domain-containing protein [Pseudobacteriovorax antillogorgiicola]|nr:phosphatase domain-containing protein [Pseudobacteriovorax antillogorgiicola]